MPMALSGWWVFGWLVGATVILIAALLLLAIIGLGRRIARQADEITQTLEGVRTNTDPLWDIRGTNVALDRIARGLADVRAHD